MVSSRAARGAHAGLLASARAQRVLHVGRPLKQAACVGFGSEEDKRTLASAIFLKTPPEIVYFLEEAEQKVGGSIWESSLISQDPVSYLFSAFAEHEVIISFEQLEVSTTKPVKD